MKTPTETIASTRHPRAVSGVGLSVVAGPAIEGSMIELDRGRLCEVLHRTYDDQNCSIARTLEIVGERWTILILRDLVVSGPRKRGRGTIATSLE